MSIKSYIKRILPSCILTGSIPVLFLSGCGRNVVSYERPSVTETVISQETVSSPGPLASVVTGEDKDIIYRVPRIINQRVTPFGDNGCGGAAGLMALQAAGYMTDLDTDEEYSRFGAGVPKDKDPAKGWNGNGIWNPAYADWLSSFAEAKRIQDFGADDIKDHIAGRNVIVVLVSLGDTGDVTHWVAVTGFKTVDGLLLYEVADPWSGVVHEFTPSRLDKRMQEGSKRKGDQGAGYGTDGVLIKCKE